MIKSFISLLPRTSMQSMFINTLDLKSVSMHAHPLTEVVLQHQHYIVNDKASVYTIYIYNINNKF